MCVTKAFQTLFKSRWDNYRLSGLLRPPMVYAEYALRFAAPSKIVSAPHEDLHESVATVPDVTARRSAFPSAP
jgi:hypothetical protein